MVRKPLFLYRQVVFLGPQKLLALSNLTLQERLEREEKPAQLGFSAKRSQPLKAYEKINQESR